MSGHDLSATATAQQRLKGSIFEGRVRALTSFGALVTLKNGAKGIIRNRELTWENEPAHPGDLLTKGQKVKVIVLAVEQEGRRLNLSLRQALRDPWKGIDQKYRVGETVRGKVVGLWHTGAFVELEPAIDGFVLLHEVSDSPPGKIEQALWIGDSVEAVITRLNYEERHITLSIKQRLTSLNSQRENAFRQLYLEDEDGGKVALGELLNDQSRTALLNLFKVHAEDPAQISGGESYTRAALVEKLPRVLIADNDRGFRTSLQRLLTRLGHQVEAVDSAEKAVALCSNERFHLLLIDFSFRAEMIDGLEAARQILLARPDLPVIIITGIRAADTYSTLAHQARAIGVKSVLLKPVKLGSIYRVIEAIVSDKDAWEVAGVPDTFEQASINPVMPRHLTFASEKPIRSVREELMSLQKLTGAKACVLFEMESVTHEVCVFTHAGSHLIGYDASKYNLQASPIADVIQQGEQVFENDVSQKPQRFQHLRVLDFASCIGVPVESFAHTGYGLFLFHGQKRHFTRQHLRQAVTTARLISAILTREHAERLVQRVQPFVFIGQTTSTLVHELNNRLGSVVNTAETLKRDSALMERDPSKVAHPNLRVEIQKCIRSLERNSKAMEKITELYMGMVATEKQGLTYINELIQDVVGILGSVAENNRVRILTELEDDIPPTLSIKVRLEQSFVNVILNAVQQIGLGHSGRELIIRSQFVKENSSFPIQVRFTDTGPGIHGKHLTHIFDLGFSTRPDGHGLGLFTTKWLIESLGGRIRVEKSVMLIGTTFLIELPLVLPSVQGAAG